MTLAWIAMALLVPTYDCPRGTSPVVVDGRADEPAWAAAPWTAEFVDIEGVHKPRPYLRTRAKMTWDDEALYVYAEMDEPDVWATLRARNSIVYRDNDFEVFVDPDGDGRNYYELEVNALNTVLELTLNKPYREGGNYTFETHAVRTATRVDGTLNEPGDVDRGWSAEIALPWSVMERYGGGRPNVGDAWRVNFSRVQWRHRVVDGAYVKVPKEERAEENWVWSPTSVVDMHRPERWGVVRFAR